MVNPLHDDRPAHVVFNVMKLPKRPGGIQHGTGQVADKLFQFMLIRLPWQRHTSHVGMYFEILISQPVSPSGAVYGFLTKSLECKPAGFDGFQQTLIGNWTGQRDHPRDHHQVGRLFHAKPGRIDLGYRFPVTAATHQISNGCLNRALEPALFPGLV